jgi:UDP-N-acetylglucosamine--N-acetylmuramyl-(pentapeptide) pyrophosphoryl-undecaprenol N-acetylglucosamine transferase
MKITLIGGHLSPALSVLQALPKDAQVTFIGRKYALEGDKALSLEYKTITELSIPFQEINTGRLQRKFTKFTLSSLLRFPSGIVQAFSILIRTKPDIVVGFGGYASVPVIFCAYILKIPTIVHEQTMGAGLANRMVSRFAKKICISWDSSRKYFPKDKIVLTGNPIRNFLISNSKFSIFNNNLPVVYITGGSSGSHFINVLIEGIIRELLKKYNIIHQTGDAGEFHDFDRLNKLKESLPERLRYNYLLKKFIDPSEIGDLLNTSTLVISRSGINTITELMYFEKPAILIPLPFAQDDEQLNNAKFLDKIGLGVIIKQEDASKEKLLETINQMMGKIESFKIDKSIPGSLPTMAAAQNIVSVINYVYKIKTEKKF